MGFWSRALILTRISYKGVKEVLEHKALCQDKPVLVVVMTECGPAGGTVSCRCSGTAPAR